MLCDCRSLDTRTRTELRGVMTTLTERLVTHAGENVSGNMTSLTPIAHSKKGDFNKFPRSHTECHELEAQHGLPIRDMLMHQLNADLACHTRQ